MSEEKTAAPFASLSEARQAQAMARYEVLHPHLDDTVPLPRAAADAGVPLRTAERWLLHRLFVQIGRILKINGLSVITDEVVEGARSTLVIGAT